MSAVDGRHDVVVIGGGHNGLVAACYLARAGLDVAVVEQRDWLGGMAATRPFVAQAPEHLLSPGAYENVYLRAAGVARELRLERFGYRELDAAGWGWIGEGGESLVLQRDVERSASEIARFARGDADRYRELTVVALKVLRLQDRYGLQHPSRPGLGTVALALRTVVGDRRVRRLLGSLVTGTAAEAIESTFQCEPLRGLLAGTATILCPPTLDGSAIALLAPALLHHHGAARPVGGMGGLIDALERCLRAHGGTILIGSAATAVRASRGRADTVELENGAVLHAERSVIAACAPQLVARLAGELLPADAAARLSTAPANAIGVGTLTVSMALSARLQLPRYARQDLDIRRPTLFAGTFEQVLCASAEATRGELPQRPSYCLAIFTAVDQSQAPAGQDVLQLYSPAPVAVNGGWDARRSEAAERLIAAASEVAPALCELELGRYVETSADLAARTGAPNGCIYHVDQLPTRLGPLRPALGLGGYRTPLAGLYLGSAGTHPGGGVSGLPGRLCARAVLKDLRWRNQHSFRARVSAAVSAGAGR